MTQYLFGEDQGRYILEIDKKNYTTVEKIIKNADVYFENIGITQKNYFEISGEMKTAVNDLFKVNNQWYNNF